VGLDVVLRDAIAEGTIRAKGMLGLHVPLLSCLPIPQVGLLAVLRDALSTTAPRISRPG
jgi:hypothetical protein